MSVLVGNTRLNGDGVIYRYGPIFLIMVYATVIILGIYYESEVFSVALWYVPSALLIYLLAVKEKILTAIFENKFLVFIGNISFELFLVHLMVISYYSVIYRKFIGSDIVSWSYIIPLCISVLLAMVINRKFLGEGK